MLTHRIGLSAALALMVAGCDTIAPSSVTVELANTGNFAVDAKLFVAQDQEIPEFLLTTIGEELSYTVPAGETVTFVRDCADVQAIIVDNAELLVLGGVVGQSTDSDILRDGTDYGCGDRIRFTFSHSVLGTAFRVSPSIRSGGISSDLGAQLAEGLTARN